jgi:hypothetical protein
VIEGLEANTNALILHFTTPEKAGMPRRVPRKKECEVYGRPMGVSTWDLALFQAFSPVSKIHSLAGSGQARHRPKPT